MPVSPARVLERAGRLLPRGFWERLERRRANSAAVHGLPDPEVGWMYHEPLTAALADEAEPLIRGALLRGDMDTLSLLGALPALTLWRMTRGLYQFDETLRDALLETEIDRVPRDVLRRLPEYAPYIELGGYSYAGKALHGAWVMVTTPQAGAPSLSIVGFYGQADVVTCVLDLSGDTLDECLRRTVASLAQGKAQAERMGMPPAPLPTYSDEAIQEDLRFLRHMLSLALYLCSEEPDLAGVVKAPQPSHKRKYAHTYLAPQTDNMLAVGFKHGGAIRQWKQHLAQRRSDSSGAGLPKAPHIRKAHYHLYWTGPGRTVPRVRWVAATPVNVKNLDDMPVHVRPVLDDPAADHNTDAQWARDNRTVLERLRD